MKACLLQKLDSECSEKLERTVLSRPVASLNWGHPLHDISVTSILVSASARRHIQWPISLRNAFSFLGPGSSSAVEAASPSKPIIVVTTEATLGILFPICVRRGQSLEAGVAKVCTLTYVPACRIIAPSALARHRFPPRGDNQTASYLSFCVIL